MNTIGSFELGTIWTDPDFNPDDSAFYYVRVLPGRKTLISMRRTLSVVVGDKNG